MNTDIRDARREQEQLDALHRLDEECVHLQRVGNYLQAFDRMERALVLRRHFFGADSPEVVHACKALAEMCNLLSMSFLQQDNYAVTLELLKKAEILAQQHPKEKATTLNNLACYYRRLGKLHTAMSCLKKALTIEKKTLRDARNAADTHLNICAVLSQLNKHDQALEHAQAALVTLQEEFFRKPSANDTNAADCVSAGQKDDQANQQSAQLERVSVMCIAYHNVGVEQEFLKDYESCVLSYKKGVGLAEQYLGVDHAITVTIRNSYLAARRTISTKAGSVRHASKAVSGKIKMAPVSPRALTPPSSLRLPSPIAKEKQLHPELPSPRSIVADALARGNTLPPLDPHTSAKKPTTVLSPEDPFFSPRFRFDSAKTALPPPAGTASVPSPENETAMQLSSSTDTSNDGKQGDRETLNERELLISDDSNTRAVSTQQGDQTSGEDQAIETLMQRERLDPAPQNTSGVGGLEEEQATQALVEQEQPDPRPEDSSVFGISEEEQTTETQVQQHRMDPTPEDSSVTGMSEEEPTIEAYGQQEQHDLMPAPKIKEDEQSITMPTQEDHQDTALEDTLVSRTLEEEQEITMRNQKEPEDATLEGTSAIETSEEEHDHDQQLSAQINAQERDSEIDASDTAADIDRSEVFSPDRPDPIEIVGGEETTTSLEEEEGFSVSQPTGHDTSHNGDGGDDIMVAGAHNVESYATMNSDDVEVEAPSWVEPDAPGNESVDHSISSVQAAASANSDEDFGSDSLGNILPASHGFIIDSSIVMESTEPGFEHEGDLHDSVETNWAVISPSDENVGLEDELIHSEHPVEDVTPYVESIAEAGIEFSVPFGDVDPAWFGGHETALPDSADNDPYWPHGTTADSSGADMQHYDVYTAAAADQDAAFGYSLTSASDETAWQSTELTSVEPVSDETVPNHAENDLVSDSTVMEDIPIEANTSQ